MNEYEAIVANTGYTEFTLAEHPVLVGDHDTGKVTLQPQYWNASIAGMPCPTVQTLRRWMEGA
jgi:hypothetical protein